MKSRVATFAASLAAFTSVHAQVVPTNAVVGGKTIGEWSAEFWRWGFTAPFSQHPGTDTNGSRAHVNQPGGSVFFLAGVFQISGAVSRSFTVPESKHLFLPLLTIENDNVDVDPPLTVEELRNLNAASIDLIVDVHASIDGMPAPDPFSHRAVSPVFNFFAESDDNLLSFFLSRPFTGLDDPIVAEGYYLMIEPLPVGTHVISFGGTVGPPVNFSREITDTITVVPVTLPDLAALVRESGLSEKMQRPLSRIVTRAGRALERHHPRTTIAHLRALQRQIRLALRHDLNHRDELILAAQKIIDRTKGMLR